MDVFLTTYAQFFFLLTPFFGVATLLTLTPGWDSKARRHLAWRTTGAIAIIAALIFLLGNPLFQILGLTLDAFRVGAGLLLLVSALSLAQGKRSSPEPAGSQDASDIAVVPLALPVHVGPATIGALLVLGGELKTWMEAFTRLGALALAIATVGLILHASSFLERRLGPQGLAILSKVTGLVLSGMASQFILTGLRDFLGL